MFTLHSKIFVLHLITHMVAFYDYAILQYFYTETKLSNFEVDSLNYFVRGCLTCNFKHQFCKKRHVDI